MEYGLRTPGADQFGTGPARVFGKEPEVRRPVRSGFRRPRGVMTDFAGGPGASAVTGAGRVPGGRLTTGRLPGGPPALGSRTQQRVGDGAHVELHGFPSREAWRNAAAGWYMAKASASRAPVSGSIGRTVPWTWPSRARHERLKGETPERHDQRRVETSS